MVLLLSGTTKKGFVDISMPGYVQKALEKYQHPAPPKPQHSHHCWNEPVYGQKVQYAAPEDKSSKLDSKGKRKVQSISGTFLYYARVVEPIILVALNDIGTQQAEPTEKSSKPQTG